MKPKTSIDWHIIVSNLSLFVIGMLGYFQPGFPTNSTLVQTVVPAVAAGAIAVLTAIFSHSPSATLTQIQNTATQAANADPKLRAELTALAASLATLNKNLNNPQTTGGNP